MDEQCRVRARNIEFFIGLCILLLGVSSMVVTSNVAGPLTTFDSGFLLLGLVWATFRSNFCALCIQLLLTGLVSLSCLTLLVKAAFDMKHRTFTAAAQTSMICYWSAMISISLYRAIREIKLLRASAATDLA